MHRFFNILGLWMAIGTSSALAQTPPKAPATEPALKYHAPSVASDPGHVTLSLDRLFVLSPALAPPAATQPAAEPGIAHPAIPEEKRLRIIEVLKEHIQRGDSRAAVVVGVKPLLVAAYTDELDCVAIIIYPESLVKKNDLKVGSHLLTVNTYSRVKLAPDLELGPKEMGRYGNYFPIIADFVTDDMARVDERKRGIADEEWQRCSTMGEAYRKKHPTWIRFGSPLASSLPSRAAQ